MPTTRLLALALLFSPAGCRGEGQRPAGTEKVVAERPAPVAVVPPLPLPTPSPTPAPPALPPPVDSAALDKAFAARRREVLARVPSPADSIEVLVAACGQLGGVLQMNNIDRHIYCTPAMRDAGRRCRSRADCQGACVLPGDPRAEVGAAVTGECSRSAVLEGCFQTVEGGKAQQALCKD